MAFSSDIPLQTNQLPISVDIPDTSDPNFRNMLSLTVKRISDAMNTKEGALYNRNEVATFKRYFPTVLSSNSSTSLNFRPGYRVTFDLVAMNNGVAIPVGVTAITLSLTIPPTPAIVGIVTPVMGYLAGTGPGPIYYFDPDVKATFNNTVPAAQVITITNNTGVALSQLYFVFEYLKT